MPIHDRREKAFARACSCWPFLVPDASFVKDLSGRGKAFKTANFITTREFDVKSSSSVRRPSLLPSFVKSVRPSACRSLYGLEYKSGDTEERERQEAGIAPCGQGKESRTNDDSCSHLSLFRL